LEEVQQSKCHHVAANYHHVGDDVGDGEFQGYQRRWKMWSC